MDMCCVCKERIAGTNSENSNHFFLQVCSPLMAFSLCVSSLVMSALRGLVVQPELSSASVNSSSRRAMANFESSTSQSTAMSSWLDTPSTHTLWPLGSPRWHPVHNKGHMTQVTLPTEKHAEIACRMAAEGMFSAQERHTLNYFPLKA